jgi:hypothetical protein
LEWGEVATELIREGVAYGGIRAFLSVHLAGARLNIQVDVGFGDAITPGAVEKEWRELLDFPSARLLVYTPETVIAEKLEAAVLLGMDNSRMKDFYDLHWLLSHLTFEGKVLIEAVTNTFARRRTEIPKEPPLAFTEEFYTDAQKLVQWQAFLRKGNLPVKELQDVLKEISNFLLPVLEKKVSSHIWTPEEHWHQNTKLNETN